MKNLRFQAATAASFHLPKDLALRSVTSVPAKSLGLSHRIGFLRPGYDADLVVWDVNPLHVGATPIQVYIDGLPTLDPLKVNESFSDVQGESVTDIAEPQIRPKILPSERQETCKQIENGKTVIVGITTSYLKSTANLSPASNLTIILDKGKISCLSSIQNCSSYLSSQHQTISLQNGHISPGATTLSSLGLSEIVTEESTSDGEVNYKLDPLNPNNVVYAKYGIHLEGKAFERARYGGVTSGVSMPMTGWGGGFLSGVSVGFKISGKNTTIQGGVFKDNVALHFTLGQEAKSKHIGGFLISHQTRMANQR